MSDFLIDFYKHNLKKNYFDVLFKITFNVASLLTVNRVLKRKCRLDSDGEGNLKLSKKAGKCSFSY